jgi:hypothetical protein
LNGRGFFFATNLAARPTTSTGTVLIEHASVATRRLLSRSATEENHFSQQRWHAVVHIADYPGAPMRKCNTSEYLLVTVAAITWSIL